MKRVRQHFGSVVFDKRIRTWHFIWWRNGKRRSKVIGSIREFPTKASAWKAAKPLVAAMDNQVQHTKPGSVGDLVNLYRAERMPQRRSTRRGYESWLHNHIQPRWGELAVAQLQARPVELWLQSLSIAPKSKLHIRGVLSILWDYAMWRQDVATQRNPMELVNIRCATRRVRKPVSLTVEQFQALLGALCEDACLRTMLLLAVSFGLRISEVLGLKWKDVDWLGKTIRIERGV